MEIGESVGDAEAVYAARSEPCEGVSLGARLIGGDGLIGMCKVLWLVRQWRSWPNTWRVATHRLHVGMLVWFVGCEHAGRGGAVCVAGDRRLGVV